MIQSATLQPGYRPAEQGMKNKGEKRERLEEIISSWKNEVSLTQTSSEDNLHNRIADLSKRAKTGDAEQTSETEEFLDDGSRDDRKRFNLYFGNPASNALFFVYGTAEHNEAKIAEFEEDMRRRKEADIAYHEGLEKLDEWIEDFEGAGKNFRVAEEYGHPAAKLGRLFIEAYFQDDQ